MKIDPSDFQLNCAYCDKPIPSAVSASEFSMISGEELDGGERIGILPLSRKNAPSIVAILGDLDGDECAHRAGFLPD